MKLADYLRYPAIFTPLDDGTTLIEIRGWDAAISEAKPGCDPAEMALALILDLATGYFHNRETVPAACKAQEGDHMIKLPYDAALKILLRNTMLEERYRPVDLAKGMGISTQNINQYLTLRKNTGFDLLARAFEVIGRPLQLSA